MGLNNGNIDLLPLVSCYSSTSVLLCNLWKCSHGYGTSSAVYVDDADFVDEPTSSPGEGDTTTTSGTVNAWGWYRFD